MKLQSLVYELSFLPNNGEVILDNSLIKKNINQFLELPKISAKTNTSILILSPTCEICREKLSTLADKKRLSKKYELFYADATNQDKFEQLKKEFKRIDIYPLSGTQINNINRGIFPFYIIVDPEGTILKTFIK